MTKMMDNSFGFRNYGTGITSAPSPDGEPGGGGAAGGGSGSPSSPTLTPAAPTTTVSAPATPSSTPATPSSTPVAPSGDTGIDFEALFQAGGDDLPSLSPEPAPAPPVPPVVPPTPATPGAEPGTPASVPAPPATPAAPGAPGPRSVPPSLAEPGRVAAYLRENEAAAIDVIANTVFKLSPEEEAALAQDAISAIPKLMAKCFVKLQQASFAQMDKAFPQMFDRHSTTTRAYKENEDAFFTRWPGLSAATHGELIKRVATTWRSLNPAASREQMIEEVGALVSHQAKVPMTAAPAGAPGRPAPTVPGNGRPLPPTPFAPAAGGGSGGAPQQSGSDQDFSWLSHNQGE